MLFCGRTHWSMVFNVSWSIDPSPPATHRRAAPKRCPWWRVHRTQASAGSSWSPPSLDSRWGFANDGEMGGKARSSSSSQRFCSWTCGCLLLKKNMINFGWFQATSLWLFTNETCGKSFDIFKDFTCKKSRNCDLLRIKHWKKHRLLWCQEQWKTWVHLWKKTNIQRIQRMVGSS